VALKVSDLVVFFIGIIGDLLALSFYPRLFVLFVVFNFGAFIGMLEDGPRSLDWAMFVLASYWLAMVISVARELWRLPRTMNGRTVEGVAEKEVRTVLRDFYEDDSKFHIEVKFYRDGEKLSVFIRGPGVEEDVVNAIRDMVALSVGIPPRSVSVSVREFG